MGKLLLASTFTIGLLAAMVFGVVIFILLQAHVVDLPVAIGLTIFVHVVMLLIGPVLTDLTNRWFHKMKFLTEDEVRTRYPHLAKIIGDTAKKYRFRFPRIGIIPDRNPTSFTYGSGRYNARIVFTEGIFEFLNEREVCAVAAHELGHVVNRDFIVMMIASALVQTLYEIYHVFIRSKGKRSGGAKLIALTAYACYIVGIYLLLFLSRTREYMADRFAAGIVPPQDLAGALIKVAYGIVAADDDASSVSLLHATRHLGVVDVQNAKYVGVVAHMTDSHPASLARVLAFDKVSPWAALAELQSTHPLTGKRLDFLYDLAKEQDPHFAIDIDAAIGEMHIDKGRLWRDFLTGLCVCIAPFAIGAASMFFFPPAYALGVIGLAGLFIWIPYRFPFGAKTPRTVLDLMSDPYASPVRGTPVTLTGAVIGRGVPGYVFGEDMMYRDSTGLMFLDYTSALGTLGNFFFALTKVKSLFGAPSKASGWFTRGIGSKIALASLTTEKETVESHPVLWAAMPCFILMILSGYLAFVAYYG